LQDEIFQEREQAELAALATYASWQIWVTKLGLVEVFCFEAVLELWRVSLDSTNHRSLYQISHHFAHLVILHRSHDSLTLAVWRHALATGPVEHSSESLELSSLMKLPRLWLVLLLKSLSSWLVACRPLRASKIAPPCSPVLRSWEFG
jgi:hypothetical protein